MKNNNNLFILFAFVFSLFGCNESLEDTYDEYTKNGKERYIAKCSKLNISNGWYRLILTWQNGNDATRDKIRIVWSNKNRIDTVYLKQDTTAFELKDIEDGIYRFDIVAMDALGNESLTQTTYGRPYTREHEVMRSFSRGIVKSYFLKGKMHFFTDKYSERIHEMIISYKNAAGEEKTYNLDDPSKYSNFLSIRDVSMDPRDTVYMFRKGVFDDCVDTISFDPLPISREKLFSSGFVRSIETRYGYSTTNKEAEVEFYNFIDTVQVLEFDYDIETFEDILYCQSLKKIIFGKNRYLNSTFSTPRDRSVITGDSVKSHKVINKARSELKLTFDNYGNPDRQHYFSSLFSMTHLGYPILPNITPISKDELRVYDDGNLILCTPIDLYAKLNALLDDDVKTRWETTPQQTYRNYEMMMELKVETLLRGIKISQSLYDPTLDSFTPFKMPKDITIHTSLDGAEWKSVTYSEVNVLGLGSGEITLLQFPEGQRNVRYVKIGLRDGVDNGNNCAISLGDIILYK